MVEPRTGGVYNYKTLLCTNIPELFLDKFIARPHFGRFGQLVNFVLRPRRMTCTVSYATEEEAALALREGSVYNGHQFEMSYAENENTPAQKTEEWVDPDVQAELSALSGVAWRSEYSVNKSNTLPAAGKPSAAFGSARAVGNGTAGGQAEREKERERNAERQRQPAGYKTMKLELETVMRKPAHTSEEKYRALDARDKLLRLSQTRGTTNSERLQGICADMCPEKERVLREFQRQVAVFELQPQSDELIAHELAVKQYSRSSADQETPLPHELRTEESLHMTMCYLMHEIMDACEQGDTHVGDWFHFIWDRTRSIRKEITQQELCSLSAVKLVEQCARFHIHCAARLVAEDPSVFDAIINTENLTKCLQTLKYMYHDLRLKGVQCPREAEFRGYIVLLNLANANFLWDIGQLPVELQNCTQVRRAIHFYLALQDTNFVRFFQLLREPETSYLSACMLLSYIPRLRILALHRLVQAYRAPRKYEFSSLPVSYICQMLHFTSDNEAVEFLESCGLNVNQAGRVELTRIHNPEHYKISRQFMLVESKRKQTVGECICGEPLPPNTLYINHQPHNSFNEDGYLKSSAWEAKDQLPHAGDLEHSLPTAAAATKIYADLPTPLAMDNLFKVPQVSAPVSPKIKAATPPPPQQPQQQAAQLQPTANVKAFGFGLPAPVALSYSENIFEAKPNFGSGLSGFSFVAANTQQPSAAAATALVAATTQAAEQQRQQKAADEAKLAALQQAIAAAKQREKELLELREAKAAQAERARQQKQLEEQQRQQDLLEAQQRQQQADAAAAASAANAAATAAAAAELLRKRLAREQAQLEAQSEQLFEQLLQEQLQLLCAEELSLQRSAQNLYKTLLEQHIKELVKQQLLRADYELGLMSRYWRRWRSYRRVQQQKDALFACLPLSFHTDASSQLLDAQKADQSLRLMRRYRQGESCDYSQLLSGLEEQCWLKLDLWELLARCLPQHTPGVRRFYKLLISLPHSAEGLVIEHALDRGLLQQPAGQAPLTIQAGQYINGLAHNVALCVHTIKGLPEQRAEQLAHADGIVCYVNALEPQEAANRLQFLSRNSGCSYVAVIVQQQKTQQQQQQQQLAKQLQLDSFYAYRIFNCSLAQGKQKLQLVALLQCAVQFLAKQPHRSRSTLQQLELHEWLLLNLGDMLFQRLRRHMQQDVALGRCRDSPQLCVRLYNEAVRQLQLVAGELLEDRPQLPQELRAYVEPLAAQLPLPDRLEYFVPDWQTRSSRGKILQFLELIKLPDMLPLPQAQQQRELCDWLLDYAQLSQSEQHVAAVALRATQTLELELRLGQLNYLNIVEIFARERLQFLLQRHAKQLPTAIVYRRQTMQCCFEAHWYYDLLPAEADAAATAAAAPTDAAAVQQAEPAKLNYDNVVCQAFAVLHKCRQKQIERRTLTDVSGTLNKLELSMQHFERSATTVLQVEQQQQRQLKHFTENQPLAHASKRPRLAQTSAEDSNLLDRTEQLIHVSQSSEQRRLQTLQRAKKFL